MAREARNIRLAKWLLGRPVKWIGLAVASMPLFQATGCYPDPIGALNFQLQLLVNNVLINAVNIIVQNVFHL
ncbi:MAG: hypothetical protein HZA51_11495 [Planctomycetes bacterium]|nr:hypothetical protein [Planctomycetota bacterium]